MDELKKAPHWIWYLAGGLVAAILFYLLYKKYFAGSVSSESVATTPSTSDTVATESSVPAGGATSSGGVTSSGGSFAGISTGSGAVATASNPVPSLADIATAVKTARVRQTPVLVGTTQTGVPEYVQSTPSGGYTLFTQNASANAPNLSTLLKQARAGNTSALSALAQRGFSLNSAGDLIDV